MGLRRVTLPSGRPYNAANGVTSTNSCYVGGDGVESERMKSKLMREGLYK